MSYGPNARVLKRQIELTIYGSGWLHIGYVKVATHSRCHTAFVVCYTRSINNERQPRRCAITRPSMHVALYTANSDNTSRPRSSKRTDSCRLPLLLCQPQENCNTTKDKENRNPFVRPSHFHMKSHDTILCQELASVPSRHLTSTALVPCWRLGFCCEDSYRADVAGPWTSELRRSR